MSGTYGAMQSRIADEVLGNVTATHIASAIQTAIAYYEATRFYFNTARYDDGDPVQDSGGADVQDASGLTIYQMPVLYTLPGQEYYDTTNAAALGLMIHLDNVILVQGAVNRFTLRRQTMQWMDDTNISTTWRGMPTDYGYEAQRLRFYPTPDQSYPILLAGHFKLAPLVASSDTNAWMMDGERLIRAHAEVILHRLITRDQLAMQLTMAEEQTALLGLQRKSVQNGGPSRLRIRSFF